MDDSILVHSSDIVWVHEDDLMHYGVPGMKWGRRRGSSEKTSEQRKASFKKGAKIAGVTLAVGVTVAAVIMANNGSKKIGHADASKRIQNLLDQNKPKKPEDYSVKKGSDFVNAFSMKNGIWNADISQLNSSAPRSRQAPTGPRRQGPNPNLISKPRNQSSRQTSPSLDILSNIMDESSRPPRRFG